jgi:hypothetical protein
MLNELILIKDTKNSLWLLDRFNPVYFYYNPSRRNFLSSPWFMPVPEMNDKAQCKQ